MLRLRFVVFFLFARCLPAVSIEITSIPVNRVFTVEGSGCGSGVYSTPRTLNWTAGASCVVTFTSPQPARAGTRYLFRGWQDGISSNRRTIVAPSAPVAFTASFTTQHEVAAAVSNVASNLSAPPGDYAVTPIVVSPAASAINSFGQVAGFDGAARAGFLWTPVGANATVGTVVEIGSVSSGFSSAGAINSHGQIVGTALSSSSVPQALLWSPDTSNGTTGSLTAFLGTTPAAPTAINAYGQIAGGFPTGFIWTPDTPNGTTGTANTDPRLMGLAAINDFGQAIINP